MFTRNSDKEWEEFGKKDPYYGVISADKFRIDKMDDKALEEFFKSGEDHINYLVEKTKIHLDSNFKPQTGMDFGCGVGRCTFPMAQLCNSVVGVDISESMLAKAKKHAEKKSINNIKFISSDDGLSNISEKFDFIHSFIVFQHINPKRGEKIVESMIERMNDNGIAAIQFLYHRNISSTKKLLGSIRIKIPLFHGIVNLAYGKPFSEPLMEKNCYNLNNLLYILQKKGCDNIHTLFWGSIDFSSVVIMFQKKK